MADQPPQKSFFNQITQFAVPALTIGAQAATALRYPQWGVVINMIAQPFWIYSAWRAYRQAGQIGMLVTVLMVTVILAAGIVNYWVL